MSVLCILASQSPSRRAELERAGIRPLIHVSHVDEPAVLQAFASEQQREVSDINPADQVSVLARAKALAVYDELQDIRMVATRARGVQITHYRTSQSDAQSAMSHSVTANISCSEQYDTMHSNVTVSPISQSSAMITVPVQEQQHIIVGCDSMFLFEEQVYGKPHTPGVARERLRAMRGKSGVLYTGHCVVNCADGSTHEAVSMATVHFADYTDDEIEAYIATGEPLEVAGCFTLEGIGSAFIDHIEGDSHGIIGISLPLLRTMLQQLDIPWYELWNLGDAQQGYCKFIAQSQSSQTTCSQQKVSQFSEHSTENPALSLQAPKDNIRQPGDGWVDCNCGGRHWGNNGAAGLFVLRCNAQGEPTHVILQHRAMWSAEGGTWGIPGGAIADGESPIEGAIRESQEEANIDSHAIDIIGSYCDEHGNWRYTTVFAVERSGLQVNPRANNAESIAVSWIPLDEIAQYPLLSALQSHWDDFMSMALGCLQQYQRHSAE